MDRRSFLGALATAALPFRPAQALAAAAFPVMFRKPQPHDALRPLVDPRKDRFPGEAAAMEMEQALSRWAEGGAIPVAPNAHAVAPLAARFEPVSPTVSRAVFGSEASPLAPALAAWRASLGEIRSLRFYALALSRVRVEAASRRDGQLHYRVAHWRVTWQAGQLTALTPLDETLATADHPLFDDVTDCLFGNDPAFAHQLRHGVPYWRERLDSASGIDVYANQGVSVADIDGDGWDEVYVCQPGGLPNRLFKRQPDGRFADVTARAGLDVLDDTTSALFLDLRNSGRQDAILLTTTGPLLYLNRGDGAFVHSPNAFRFASPPQGSFTGMAAADYDRDGHLDLYLCTYVYFQSEDQYRYPVPYHDAQNGPANVLFRNRLLDGGYFDDVTKAVGLSENNNRYSFAPAWCDYDHSGWPSLYVANDFGRNNLYRNREGRFTDVAATAGVEDVGPGMSAAWFDYDGDGDPDLYVANMWSAAGQRIGAEARLQPSDSWRRHAKGNSLYRNRGDGQFDETSAAEQVEMGRWGWCADGIDFDNDGTPELFCTAGMLSGAGPDLMSFFWRQVAAQSPSDSRPAPAYEDGWNAINQFIREGQAWNGNEPNVLYARLGGQYWDVSGVSGLDLAADSRAFAATDWDGDGCVDLLVKNRLGPQLRAFHNRCGQGRGVLVLGLQGTRSNRDAIGARVEVRHRGGVVSRWLQAGSGYLSQHTKWIHVGLGQEREASEVTVEWPSGLRQEFGSMAAGYRYRLVEGSPQVARERLTPSPLPTPVPVPSVLTLEPSVWLLQPVPLPVASPAPGPLCVVLTNGREPTSSDGPVVMVDLSAAHPDVQASYALFRRYLLDHRADLALPCGFLVDANERVHKLYTRRPTREEVMADLQLLREPHREKLALPFAGRYLHPPQRSYFKLGAAFLWAGYPDPALRYLEEALRQAPSNFRVQLAVGQLHLERDRLREAREHLNTAARLRPESPEVWNNLGGVEMVEGRHAEALVQFERGLALRDDLPYLLANAAQALAKLGRSADAERHLRRALTLQPNDADAANQFGLLMAKRGDAAAAIVLFQQAITHRRDHAGAINNLGVLYGQTGKPNDAIAAFQYGLEVAPEDDMLYMNLARVHLSQGERARAREAIRRLLARKPDSALARNALRELEEP